MHTNASKFNIALVPLAGLGDGNWQVRLIQVSLAIFGSTFWTNVVHLD